MILVCAWMYLHGGIPPIWLESALKYEIAFQKLHLTDINYKFYPTPEEWRRGSQICKFLNSFYTITTLMSGQSYPTSNLYFIQVWRIECLLNENAESDDEVIKRMAQPMK